MLIYVANTSLIMIAILLNSSKFIEMKVEYFNTEIGEQNMVKPIPIFND